MAVRRRLNITTRGFSTASSLDPPRRMRTNGIGPRGVKGCFSELCFDQRARIKARTGLGSGLLCVRWGLDQKTGCLLGESPAKTDCAGSGMDCAGSSVGRGDVLRWLRGDSPLVEGRFSTGQGEHEARIW